MSLTLGTTVFDIEDLDLPFMQLHVRFGGTKFTPHESAIAQELEKLRIRQVMQYDCADGDISLFAVDPKDRAIHLEFRPYFVGFSKKGHHTPKAKKAVIDALVAAAGFTNSIELEGALRQAFGTFKAAVPVKKLIDAVGAHRSFKADAIVEWDLMRIKLPKGAPNGDVLIAFPFAVQFVARATFDCKTKTAVDILSTDAFTYLPMIPWVPKDKAPRSAAQAAAENEIEKEKRRLKRNENILDDFKKRIVEDPENDRFKAAAATYKRNVKRSKRRIKDYTKLRDALKREG